jgi:hypothetical protein
MNQFLVAIDMSVVCQDQQERSSVSITLVDDTVVVKTADGKILSGPTKMIEILSLTCVSDPGVLAYAIQKYKEAEE